MFNAMKHRTIPAAILALLVASMAAPAPAGAWAGDGRSEPPDAPRPRRQRRAVQRQDCPLGFQSRFDFTFDSRPGPRDFDRPGPRPVARRQPLRRLRGPADNVRLAWAGEADPPPPPADDRPRMRRRPRANDEPGPAFRGPRRDFNDRQSDDGRPGHRRGFRGRGPGAGRGPGPDDAPAFSRDLTGEQVEHMLSFLKDKFPSRFEQLQKLRETNPDVFDPRFRRMAPRIQRMMQAFERHPETAEMMVREHQINVQIDVLVDRFFDARDENVLNEIHGQIRDLVAERFELRQQRRQREIETMQRRLESIREQLQHDTQQRDDIIEHELKDLGVTDR